jgi:hypothetical protein
LSDDLKPPSFEVRSSHDARARFAALARRISAWTNNLVVTAVALAVAVALGWQLMGWLHETPAEMPTTQALAAANLPPIDRQREFWTSGGLVKVERLLGTPGDAQSAMRAFCRQTIDRDHQRKAGPGEAAFVTQLLAEQPLEELPGLALYQPPGQAAMVVAVDRESRQILSWSFALPSPDGSWSLYHFRPK